MYDYNINMIRDSYLLGNLALDGWVQDSGSFLIDRDIAWLATRSDHGAPMGLLVGRPAFFFHTLHLNAPDLVLARRLIERGRGYMDGSDSLKTALFQVADDNATMGRLAARLGGVADPGQLWRVDI